MTKRKVHSGNPNSNRRHGGHRRSNSHGKPAQGAERERESETESRPRNHEYNRNSNRNNFAPQQILPSPTILQEYEYASDGAAARIIEMAEVEQDRRNEWELEYMRFYKKSLRLGQLFGFLLLVIIVLAVVSLANQGKDQVAQILAASAFLSVAIASIFSGGSMRRNARRPKFDRSKGRR
jgi:uncharacterized membrane protein